MLIVLTLALVPWPTLLARAPTTRRNVIYIQPLGKELPDRSVVLVKRALVAFYGLQVKLLPRVALPRQAYYRPRRRYRAEKLLAFLAPRLPADGLRILGLTGVGGLLHVWRTWSTQPPGIRNDGSVTRSLTRGWTG